jgi:hypothetical protein
VTSTPLYGQVFSSERAISGKVSPITSWWSSRMLVMTPMFERTIIFSLIAWYCGFSAMHFDHQCAHVAVHVLLGHLDLLEDGRCRLAMDRLVDAVAVDHRRSGAGRLGDRDDSALSQEPGDDARDRRFAADSVDVDAEVELVDPSAMRERLAPPPREKREAHEVPADDCHWHGKIIGILDTSLKVIREGISI